MLFLVINQSYEKKNPSFPRREYMMGDPPSPAFGLPIAEFSSSWKTGLPQGSSGSGVQKGWD
jgi:hypothetical protein